jgi:hypothetical protein
VIRSNTSSSIYSAVRSKQFNNYLCPNNLAASEGIVHINKKKYFEISHDAPERRGAECGNRWTRVFRLCSSIWRDLTSGNPPVRMAWSVQEQSGGLVTRRSTTTKKAKASVTFRDIIKTAAANHLSNPPRETLVPDYTNCTNVWRVLMYQLLIIRYFFAYIN